MLKTCRCLWESGLHFDAEVYVFKHGVLENMGKSLRLSRSSGANFVQSVLFPVATKPLLTLSFLHICIYKGFPRQKHVPMCQTLALCTSSKDNISAMYHTPSSFSVDLANTSWKHQSHCVVLHSTATET